MLPERGCVSIPIGFSSSLQRKCSERSKGHVCSFNPYRVFKFAATAAASGAGRATGMMFQSLSGFQVRCNSMTITAPMNSAEGFQSLSGFQVRCNLGIDDHPPAARLVSIPIGFSSSLQHWGPAVGTSRSSRCFNPYRVFKFAATKGFCLMPGDVVMFQSLSGFQVRCNPTEDLTYSQGKRCFNPYRVFKFAATETLREWGPPLWGFQSLSGFQVRCNYDSHVVQAGAYWVSIPIGFSSSLQHNAEQLAGGMAWGFNPYRVFKFAATFVLPKTF